MTVNEIAREAQDLAREHWWNGAGAVVVFFLLATFVWKRPDNDYLLYAALVVTCVHAYLSVLCFGQNRAQLRHRKEIAVAYRAHLKAVQDTQSRETHHVRHRPVAGRNGNTPHRV